MAFKTNITLGLIGNYCNFPDVQLVDGGSLVANYTISASVSLNQLKLPSAYSYINDAAVIAAIDMVNESNDILPNVHVNVKRFTDCGGYYPGVLELYNGYSGGYAGSIMSNEIGLSYTDVVGVIGIEYSTTARNVAEVLSQYQIPYCSSGSSSPRLSNKNRYPYFFRTLTSKGLGRHIYQLLKVWNVKRVAILFQRDDDMGIQFGFDIFETMSQNSVRVVANLGIPSAMDTDDLQYVRQQILQNDARYIIVSGQSAFTSAVYYAMANVGLVGDKYVWIGYNTPANVISSQDMNVYKSIQGFILFIQQPPDITTPSFKAFHERVLQLAEITKPDLTAEVLADSSYIGAAPSFDCVMAMLIGFDQFLRKTGFSVVALANRELQQFLNYTVFRQTKHVGLDAVLDFNEYGDLLLSYQVTYFNGDYYNQTVFGHTSSDATAFLASNSASVKFNDGSSIPPSDGSKSSPVLHSYTGRTAEGLALIVVSTLGILASLSSALFIIMNHKNKFIKASSVHESLVIVLGCCTVFVALLFWVDDLTAIKCRFRQTLLSIGYCLATSTIVCKNVLLVCMFGKEKPARKPVKLIAAARGFNITLVGINFLLGIWSVFFGPVTIAISLADAQNSYFKTCQAAKTSIASTLLYYYNILLGLSLLPILFLVTKRAMGIT
ncbi:periplasmic binding protein-like I [Obelidium mucronatum]|nr:periplasmic binding protein-like I [Obelidium mucronatum]